MARKYITPDEYRARFTGAPQRGAKYDDSTLNAYIEIATANVEQYTERCFEWTEWSETFRGDGTATWLAYQYPMQTSGDYVPVIEVLTTTGTTEGSIDFATAAVNTTANAAQGRIELDVDTFGAGNLYRVTYTAGFAEIPVAVKHATALWVAELMRPDYFPGDGRTPEIIPLSSEQITDLLGPLRRRRISRV
jgi:hypothetical protein